MLSSPKFWLCMIGLLAIVVVLLIVLVPRDTFLVLPESEYERIREKKLFPLFKGRHNYRRIKRRVAFPRRYEYSKSSSDDVSSRSPSDRRADIQPVESPSTPPAPPPARPAPPPAPPPVKSEKKDSGSNLVKETYYCCC